MKQSVLSGMRPTGLLHIGHYFGALKNWVKMQNDYQCYYTIVDLHALTTHYDEQQNIATHSLEMLRDWLAVGIDENKSVCFLQSQIPAHAELHTILSMITPLSWLERIPSFKDQQQKLKHKNLSTYGFLGYPLLQAADILLYEPKYVPVGEDQASHIEFAREVARRFNEFFGKENFAQKVEEALALFNAQKRRDYKQLRKKFQTTGDEKLLLIADDFLKQNTQNPHTDILKNYLKNDSQSLLKEPECLLTQTPKTPGLDGQKMSKSYKNTIALRDDEKTVWERIRSAKTDTARVKISDKGNPDNCPIFSFHKLLSTNDEVKNVDNDCRKALIGCVDCKKILHKNTNNFLDPIRQKAAQIHDDDLRHILEKGKQKATKRAEKTLKKVKKAVGFYD